MNKKQLGFKSYKWFMTGILLLMLILFLLSLFIFSLIMKEYKVLILIILVLIPLGIYFIYDYHNMFSLPKVVIEYDESGVYLNYRKNKTIYLLFKDIESVEERKYLIHRKFRSSYFTSYGFIIIQTKDKKYKIGCIRYVNVSKKFIYKRIEWKYTKSMIRSGDYR